MGAFIAADRMDTEPDGKVRLRGAAEVRRLDAVAKGDDIDYMPDTGEVNVSGNGVLMREASIIHAPSFSYNLDSRSGEASYPSFWLGEGGGGGTANHIDIIDSSQMRLTDLEYSGCPCPDRAWYISSPDVALDFDKNQGIARHGVLRFKEVPILYSPWLSFPIKEERKSGFLLPTVGISSKSGLDLAVPYYLNLAPNYDATLTPRYLSKRGLQLGGEFRYLGRNHFGILNGAYLAKDRQLGQKRWLIDWQHSHRLGSQLNASFRFNRVSDGDYFRDFSSLGLTDSVQHHLRSHATLDWQASPYVSARLSATKYQTLQDRTSRYRRPAFDKLPELSINAGRYNWGGFDVISKNTITRFSMPRFIYGTHAYSDFFSRTNLAPYQSFDGTRYSSYNTIRYPIIRPGWYITPKVGLHLSHYNTRWNGFGPPGAAWDPGKNRYQDGPKSQSRVLPIMSLDAGMTFERPTRLFGNDAVQTLEPRLYYLRVPYRDQSNLPVYDTSLATFNIAQAFDENIFSGGWDRIANANQLTVGLTSRWMDADSGFERLSLTAAQRIYFDDQRVTLNTRHNRRTDRKSDYLVGAQAALTDKFRVSFDAQFNPDSRQRNRMAAGIKWEPKRLATVSATYRYDRDLNALMYHNEPDPSKRRERISISAQWPFSSNWYGLGRYDYSFSESRSTQSIVGVEYKGDCCWAARAVLQRYAVSRRDVNTAFFFQLELTGLGSLGTDAMGLLKDHIVGYEKVTTTPSELTTFERYE